MFPTRTEGITRDFQLFAFAKATLVAGPPIAALDATRSRCLQSGPSERPHSWCNPARISPCIVYKQVKKSPSGTTEAFTVSASLTPGAPAVAKNKYRNNVPNISDVSRSGPIQEFGTKDVKRTVTTEQIGNVADFPPNLSLRHSRTLEMKRTNVVF